MNNRNQSNIRDINKGQRESPACVASGGGTRYDAPCRYWRFGTCKMADHCRFSHSETPDDPIDIYNGSLRLSRSMDSDLSMTSSGSSISEDFSQLTDDLQRMRLSRRPFVHVIVLYAGGIGVLTVPPSGHVDGKVTAFARDVCARFADSSIDFFFHCKLDSLHFIRTENLSEIIGHSKSDHLVVIGDRNMKNRTIQVRRRAKLVEMSIEEATCFIWSEVEFETEDQSDPSLLGTNELYNLMDRYCAVRHYKERVDRLRCDMEELDRLSSSEPWITDASGNSVMSERAQFKLTQVQRSLIRMHQQLHEATDRLEAEEENEISRRGTEICDPAHNPAPCHPIIGICPEIHRILYEFSAKLMYALENGLVRRRLKEYLNSMVLWNGYYQEFSDGEDEEDFWRCEACTLVNNPVANVCDVCQCPRNSSVVDSGEGEWLEAGRSRRKMARQQHHAERIPVPRSSLALRMSADSTPGQRSGISPPAAPRERSLSSSSISSMNNRWAHPPVIVPDARRRAEISRRTSDLQIQPKPVGRAVSLETVRSEDGMLCHRLRSLPVSPSKPNASFFSDLWSDHSRSNCYSSLPSTNFEFVPHHLELFSHRELSHENAQIAELMPVNQNIAQQALNFDKPGGEMVSPYGAERPCLCCGEESFMECTFCARAGLPPAFFCSAEHQAKLWRQHSLQHQLQLSNPQKNSGNIQQPIAPPPSIYNERYVQPVQGMNSDVSNRGGHAVSDRGGPQRMMSQQVLGFGYPASIYNAPGMNYYGPQGPRFIPEFDMFQGRDFGPQYLSEVSHGPMENRGFPHPQVSQGMHGEYFTGPFGPVAPTGIFG